MQIFLLARTQQHRRHDFHHYDFRHPNFRQHAFGTRRPENHRYGKKRKTFHARCHSARKQGGDMNGTREPERGSFFLAQTPRCFPTANADGLAAEGTYRRISSRPFRHCLGSVPTTCSERNPCSAEPATPSGLSPVREESESNQLLFDSGHFMAQSRDHETEVMDGWGILRTKSEPIRPAKPRVHAPSVYDPGPASLSPKSKVATHQMMRRAQHLENVNTRALTRQTPSPVM